LPQHPQGGILRGRAAVERPTMIIAFASFAWVSDYSQFYLVDSVDLAIADIDKLELQTYERDWYAGPSGLVVYTVDCLRQEIRILLHDAEPTTLPDMDAMTGSPWKRTALADVIFPSGRFTLGSPSRGGGSAHGPHFIAPRKQMRTRIAWLEFEEETYDPFRPKADVIQLDLWPR
jgi:hypothetical protein